MKKTVMIVLVAAALGFTTAPPAHAWSNFIIHMAAKACNGKSATFKNGCYAYIEAGIDYAKSSSEAIEWCKETRCDQWFSSPSRESVCYSACEYLNEMDN